MSNKIDLREPICRAFTTEPTTAGGAKLPVSGNFFRFSNNGIHERR